MKSPSSRKPGVDVDSIADARVVVIEQGSGCGIR